MSAASASLLRLTTLLRRFPGLVVLAGFVGAAAWIWRPVPAPDLPVSQPAALDLADRLTKVEERLTALAAVTAERPLFQPTRRPALAPEAPVALAAPDPTLSLVGILGDRDNQIALVRLSNGPDLYRVEAGSQLANWQIVRIGEASVEVRKDGGSPITLKIGQ